MSDLRTAVTEMLADTHTELERVKAKSRDAYAFRKGLYPVHQGEAAALKRVIVKLQRVLEDE